MKEILTFEQLCDYLITNGVQTFSNGENGKSIVVQSLCHASFEFDEEDITKVRLKMMHDSVNRNNSNIPNDVLDACKETFKNKPILAEIVEKDDGTKDFGHHAIEVKKNEDGDEEFYYIESPVGVIPESCNMSMEYDADKKKTYLCVDGLIYNYYGNETIDILQRRGGTDVSVEISLDKFSWDAKEKRLNIEQFTGLGVTLLGADVMPGMEGARCALFSNEDNTKSQRKEETQMTDNNDVVLEENYELAPDTSVETVDSVEEVVVETVEFSEDETTENNPELTEVQKFALSLNEKIEAVSDLVNVAYSEADDDWYYSDVYDDYVVFRGCCKKKHYKQSFTEEDGKYSLVGDRVEVFVVYLTQAEIDAIEDKERDYKSLMEYKQSAEAEKARCAKLAIIDDNEKFASIKDSGVYDSLIENVDKYSFEEFGKEVKCIFADCDSVCTNIAPRPTVKVNYSLAENKRGKAYGSLFD